MKSSKIINGLALGLGILALSATAPALAHGGDGGYHHGHGGYYHGGGYRGGYYGGGYYGGGYYGGGFGPGLVVGTGLVTGAVITNNSCRRVFCNMYYDRYGARYRQCVSRWVC
jgi:hypothetical protein